MKRQKPTGQLKQQEQYFKLFLNSSYGFFRLSHEKYSRTTIVGEDSIRLGLELVGENANRTLLCRYRGPARTPTSDQIEAAKAKADQLTTDRVKAAALRRDYLKSLQFREKTFLVGPLIPLMLVGPLIIIIRHSFFLLLAGISG